MQFCEQLWMRLSPASCVQVGGGGGYCLRSTARIHAIDFTVHKDQVGKLVPGPVVKGVRRN
jgi:hypothetical protein